MPTQSRCAMTQVAAAAALSGEQLHVAEFRQAIPRRRALACERLDRLDDYFGI